MPLTGVEITELHETSRRKDIAGDLIKASGYTRAEVEAAFQAIDTWWESNRVGLKAVVDAAVGKTLTNPETKAIGKAWLLWKWRKE